jgi:hypothetical protein
MRDHDGKRWNCGFSGALFAGRARGKRARRKRLVPVRSRT